MKKKKKWLIAGLLILLAISVDFFVLHFVKAEDSGESQVDFILDVRTDTLDEYQLFFSDTQTFDEEESSKASVGEIGDLQELIMGMQANAACLRLDFGMWPAHIYIDSVYVRAGEEEKEIPLSQIAACVDSHSIRTMKLQNDELYIETDQDDPYIVFHVSLTELTDHLQKTAEKNAWFLRVFLCVLADFVILILALNSDILVDSGINAIRDKKLIFDLAKNDFKTRYAGSYFGIIWAFVQPVIMILVYWFALGVGLRSGQTMSYPFVLWLMCGLVPWFFFSDALGSGTNALTEYSYLVKKVVFKINILPIVKIVSALFVHLVFVALVILLHACYGYYPSWYTLQIFYYITCNFALAMALIYLTSSAVVFFKDLNQIIGIILQVGIWATPIMWDASGFSSKMNMVLKLNPVYYVVNGFRDSLLEEVWFWERPAWTVCFWSIVILLYVIGRRVFKKLQIHFADVL